MTLITRLTRLFQADFHAVLDHIEEPEALLRQAIREMQEDLSRREQGIRLTQREQKESLARQRQLEDRVREADEELDLCLSSGKDDLSKGLVRRKLEAQRLLQHLVTRHARLAESLERRESAFARQRAILDGLRQKAELIHVSAAADECESVSWTGRDRAVTDDEVEVAFFKEKNARSRS